MFGRFTEKARAVIVAAHEESAGLGHGWVGTEHLLLGLARLGDDPGAAGPRTLRQLGFTEQTVREHVLRRLPPTRRRSDHHSVGESRYPGAFRVVLQRAAQAALRREKEHISSEHLLVGLLEECSCTGARLLAELGVSLNAVLRQLGTGQPVAEAAPPGPYEPMVALTAPAVPVLELARQQAVEDGSGGRVGTHHYLLALLSQRDTQAASVLASFGVDYEPVKARLMALGEDEPVEPPRPAAPRSPSNTSRVEVPNDEHFTALVGEVARLLPAGAALGFNSDGDVAWIVTSGNVDLAALVEQAQARLAEPGADDVRHRAS
jgi:ATP-dependent Clp protease ATP-binding subunit ClpA